MLQDNFSEAYKEERKATISSNSYFPSPSPQPSSSSRAKVGDGKTITGVFREMD